MRTTSNPSTIAALPAADGPASTLHLHAIAMAYDRAHSHRPAQVHLFDRVAVISKHYKVVIAIAALVITGMMYRVYTMTPMYTATARLHIEEEQTARSFDEASVVYQDPEPFYQTQYKVLQSRDLAQRAVRRLELDAVPEFNGQGPAPTKVNAISTLVVRKMLAPFRAAPPAVPSAGSVGEDGLTAAFQSRLRVAPVRGSRLVDVSFTSVDARRAADAVNVLAEEYVAQNIELRRHDTDSSLQWLKQEVARQQQSVQSAERLLGEYRANHNAVSLDDRQNIVTARLNEINYAVTTAQTERVRREAIYRQAADATHRETLGPVSAQTNAAGVATRPNVSLGSTLETAIAAGSYPNAVQASFAGLGVYQASEGSAALDVKKRTTSLVISGDGTFPYDGQPQAASGSATGIFGEDLGELSITYTDDETGAPITGAPVNAGTYRIHATSPDTTNYASATSRSLTITITPVPVTVTAEDKERLVGTPNPPLTVTYTGFVNGETAENLDVPPTVTTTAWLESPPGQYAIVASGAFDPNYVISYVSGTLTVTYEGRIFGDGFIVANGVQHHFNFDVRESIRRGEQGALRLNVERNGDRFEALGVTSVMFADNPAVTPGPVNQSRVDTVVFAGTGLWNGTAATYEAVAIDAGEPGTQDTFSITIRAAGVDVLSLGGPLGGGNVQSN